MVEVKYIKRAGKLHGPYYYKSVRDSKGNVKKVYLGKVDPEASKKENLSKKKQIDSLNFSELLEYKKNNLDLQRTNNSGYIAPGYYSSDLRYSNDLRNFNNSRSRIKRFDEGFKRRNSNLPKGLVLFLILVIFVGGFVFFYFQDSGVTGITGNYLLGVDKVVSASAILEVDGISQPIPAQLIKKNEDWYYNLTTMHLSLSPGKHTIKVIDEGDIVYEENFIVKGNGLNNSLEIGGVIFNDNNLTSQSNQTSFSTQSSGFGTQDFSIQATVSACATISTIGEHILDQNLVSADGNTCITLGINNITLNLNGFNITNVLNGGQYAISAGNLDNITIKNGFIHSDVQGVGISNITNLTIFNMTIYNISGTAISSNAPVIKNNISYNTFYNVSTAIYFGSGYWNTIVYNNFYNLTNGFGTAVDNQINNSLFLNNTFVNFSGSAIDLKGFGNVIENNSFFDLGVNTEAIYLYENGTANLIEGGNITIRGNLFSGSLQDTRSAISVGMSNVLIVNNTFLNITSYPIMIGRDSMFPEGILEIQNITVLNNRMDNLGIPIFHSSQAGIYSIPMYVRNLTVIGNNFANFSRPIWITNGSSGVNIDNNNFTKVLGTGFIIFNGSYVNFTNFYIDGVFETYPILMMNFTDTNFVRFENVTVNGTGINSFSNEIIFINSYNDTFINFNLYNGTIAYVPKAGSVIQVNYSNSFGTIIWNLTNFTVSNELALGKAVFIESNKIGLVDASGYGNLNKTARIIFKGLSYPAAPWVLKNGVRCDNDSSLCAINSYSEGALDINVSSFSNYTTFNVPIISCPYTINTSGSYTLGNDITGEVYGCLNITTGNVTVDCLGYMINYASQFAGSSYNWGINVSGLNVTIKNCNLNQTASFQNVHGILVGANSSANLINISVTVNAGSNGASAVLFDTNSLSGSIINSTFLYSVAGNTHNLVVIKSNSHNITGNLFNFTDAQNTQGRLGLSVSGNNSNILNNDIPFGLSVTGYGNQIVGNNISNYGQGAGTGSTALLLNAQAIGNLVANNTITHDNRYASGSASYLVQISDNAGGAPSYSVFQNNTIYGAGYGIDMQNVVGVNFTNNLIYNTSYGVKILNSTGLYLSGDSIAGILNSIYIYNRSSANFTNLSVGYNFFINSSNVSFLNSSFFNYSNTGVLNTSYYLHYSSVVVNITHERNYSGNLIVAPNLIGVVPESLVELNATANLTLNVGAGRVYTLLARNGIYCNSSICNNKNYNPTTGIYTFDVTQFSNYSVLNSVNITGCINITEPGIYTLSNNVGSAGYCINITSSNVTLDCLGYTINHSEAGGSGGFGVYSQNMDNITIKNCIINQSTNTNSKGINFNSCSNLTLTNNTIWFGSGSSFGIFVTGGSDVIIEDSTIDAIGNDAAGISFSAIRGVIRNNRLNITSGSTNASIVLINNVGPNNISGNFLSSLDSSNAADLLLINSNNTFIYNNTIYGPLSSGGSAVLITDNSQNNTLDSNLLIGRASDSTLDGSAFNLLPGLGNVVKNNIINESAIAVVLVSASNWNFTNNTINNVTQGFYFINSTGISVVGGNISSTGYSLQIINLSFVNLTNVWFSNLLFLNSSNISFKDVYFVNNSLDAAGFNTSYYLHYDWFSINQTSERNTTNNLVIGPNFIEVNSNNLPEFNTTANITLVADTGILVPKAIRNDLDCPSIYCSNLNYNSGTGAGSFDVSQFTNYSISASVYTLTGCGNISNSGLYNLTNNIASAGTCINITSGNVTVDCSGYTINYSESSQGYGITSTSVEQIFNVTIKNCFINQTSNTASSSGIYFKNVSSLFVINNSINIKASSSRGVDIFQGELVNITGNSINTSGSSGYGVYLQYSAGSNIFQENYINTSGINGEALYLRFVVFNNSIISNSIKTTATGNARAIYLEQNTINSTIAFNVINTTGDASWPIVIFKDANNSVFYMNNISTGDDILYGNEGIGIYVYTNGKCPNCNITGNKMVLPGEDSVGVYLKSADNSFIAGNVINASYLGDNAAWSDLGFYLQGDNITLIDNVLIVQNNFSACIHSFNSKNLFLSNNSLTCLGSNLYLQNVSNLTIDTNITARNYSLYLTTFSVINLSNLYLGYNIFINNSNLTLNNVYLVNNSQDLSLNTSFMLHYDYVYVNNSVERDVKSNMYIQPNLIGVISENLPEFSTTANLTFYAEGFSASYALRNGTKCLSPICTNATRNLTSWVHSFDVTQFTNYSVANGTIPTISFSCTPSSVTVGGSITCGCSATDIADPNPIVSFTASPSTSAEGTFSTTCTATNYLGLTSSSSVSYTVNAQGDGGGTTPPPPPPPPPESVVQTQTQTVVSVGPSGGGNFTLIKLPQGTLKFGYSQDKNVEKPKLDLSLNAETASVTFPTDLNFVPNYLYLVVLLVIGFLSLVGIFVYYSRARY